MKLFPATNSNTNFCSPAFLNAAASSAQVVNLRHVPMTGARAIPKVSGERTLAQAVVS